MRLKNRLFPSLLIEAQSLKKLKLCVKTLTAICQFSHHIRNILCKILQEELLRLRLIHDMCLLSTFVLAVRRFLKTLITFLLLKLFRQKQMIFFNLKRNFEEVIRLILKRFQTALSFNQMRLKITLLQPSMMTFHRRNQKMRLKELLRRKELSFSKKNLKNT